MALAADDQGERTPEIGLPWRARCPESPATTTVLRTAAMRGRPRWVHSAIGTWNSVPTEPRAMSGWKTSGMSHATSAVAGRARGADDRAEVARALDSLRDEDQRAGRVGERRERRRPALDDGDQAVGPRRGGDRVERVAQTSTRAPRRSASATSAGSVSPRKSSGRRPPHGSLPGPPARAGAGGGPRRGRQPGSRRRERRRTALSRSFALLVMIGRRVTRATGRGVGATNGDGAVRRVVACVRTRRPPGPAAAMGEWSLPGHESRTIRAGRRSDKGG